PGWTYQRLSTAFGSPRSGRMIGTCRDVFTGGHHFIGMITGPHKRPSHNLAEAEQPRRCGERIELHRRHETSHRNVLQRGGEILPKCEDITPNAPKIGEDFEEFLDRLADSQHQPG